MKQEQIDIIRNLGSEVTAECKRHYEVLRPISDKIFYLRMNGDTANEVTKLLAEHLIEVNLHQENSKKLAVKATIIRNSCDHKLPNSDDARDFRGCCYICGKNWQEVLEERRKDADRTLD